MRIDFDEDDENVIKPLILTSNAIIKKTTGVKAEDVQEDTEASALYITLQKMIITNLYEHRDGAGNNNAIIVQLSTLLSTYKPSN
jgi:hypothetical protein